MSFHCATGKRNVLAQFFQEPSGGSSGTLKTRLSRQITVRRCVASGISFGSASSNLSENTTKKEGTTNGDQRDCQREIRAGCLARGYRRQLMLWSERERRWLLRRSDHVQFVRRQSGRA